jgi:hypothetical protein
MGRPVVDASNASVYRYGRRRYRRSRARRQVFRHSSPKDHGSWSTLDFIEWAREKGRSEPMPIQRAKSSGVAFSAKPPMSGPARGWPLSPRLRIMEIDQRRCVQSETLSPVHVAA